MAEVLRNLRTQIGQAFSVDEMSSNNDMRLLTNAPPSTQTMGTSHQNAQLPQPGETFLFLRVKPWVIFVHDGIK